MNKKKTQTMLDIVNLFIINSKPTVKPPARTLLRLAAKEIPRLDMASYTVSYSEIRKDFEILRKIGYDTKLLRVKNTPHLICYYAHIAEDGSEFNTMLLPMEAEFHTVQDLIKEFVK